MIPTCIYSTTLLYDELSMQTTIGMYVCVQYLLIADTADILLWIRVIVNMGAIAATPLPVSLIYQK